MEWALLVSVYCFLLFFVRCLLPFDVGYLVFGGGAVRVSALALGYCLYFAGSCCLSFTALCFRRPGSGAQWLAAVANFGVYVDGKGGPGFSQRMCFLGIAPYRSDSLE